MKNTKEKPLKKGDLIWCTLKGAEQNFGYGEIHEVFYHNDIQCFFYFCQVNGGLRFSSIDMIIEKPNQRMENKLFECQKALQEVLKNRK